MTPRRDDNLLFFEVAENAADDEHGEEEETQQAALPKAQSYSSDDRIVPERVALIGRTFSSVDVRTGTAIGSIAGGDEVEMESIMIITNTEKMIGLVCQSQRAWIKVNTLRACQRETDEGVTGFRSP